VERGTRTARVRARLLRRVPARSRREQRRGAVSRRGKSGLLAAAVDQLDPVVVRVADEAEQRAALAHAVRLPLGLDALLFQRGERLPEVVDREGDVSIPRADVVRAAVVVERELELLSLAGGAEEVVRRFLFAVADDVHVAAELQAERLVERAALLGIGDPIHGVQIAR